jgi:putative ABC transport system permease protein
MGFKNPEEALNEQIFFWGDTFNIIGVLKDYHQESLKKDFEPLIFRLTPDARNFYSVKVKTSNMQDVIQKAESAWDLAFRGNPFEYFFLDDYYNEQYKADQQFGKVFSLFSLLAIFIACLGLFGLSSYTVVQRTKEIGIRKVLGATVHQVILLLCKDYIFLIIIAVGISVPISWYVMNNWLNDFAYRISLDWWIFALPSLVVIFIALMTITSHTFKAASTNPATSLRYE